MRKLKALCMWLLAVLLFLSFSFSKTVFADVPVVSNVIIWNGDTDVMLNITIIHNDPSQSHYVDKIELNIGGDVQTIQYASQPSANYTITRNLGPIQGTPSLTVRANCIQHGWSPSWTGTVPEFSLPLILLTLASVAYIVIILSRKTKAGFNSQLEAA